MTIYSPIRKGDLKIKRQWLIPIIISLLLVAVIGFWGYGQYRENRKLETFLGNRYQQTFYEMVDSVEQVQVLLGKALVSSSPKQNILTLSDIWRYSMTAQSELNRLPLEERVLLRTATFLSQTGDYAHVLARKNSEGQVLTEDNRRQLQKLREQAGKLNEALSSLESEVLEGRVNWAEVVSGARRQIAGQKPVAVSEEFTDIQEEMTKYPTLIYDGPFSDHIREMEPRGLKGSEITRDEARKKAVETVDRVNDEELKVVDSRTISGRIPAYNFQLRAEDGDNIYSVDISKKGGHLLNTIYNRGVNSSEISIEDAAEKAREYLASIGYPGMHPTYAESKDNIAYISFAYKSEDIIYYPDIIDVQVALDNGQIMAVEALGYLVSHTERDPDSPRISKKEARELVQERFSKIESIKLAVIPTDSLKEVLTYEIRGQIGEETYLVYVNVDSGVEEQILKLVKDRGGTFTI